MELGSERADNGRGSGSKREEERWEGPQGYWVHMGTREL